MDGESIVFLLSYSESPHYCRCNHVFSFIVSCVFEIFVLCSLYHSESTHNFNSFYTCMQDDFQNLFWPPGRVGSYVFLLWIEQKSKRDWSRRVKRFSFNVYFINRYLLILILIIFFLHFGWKVFGIFHYNLAFF